MTFSVGIDPFVIALNRSPSFFFQDYRYNKLQKLSFLFVLSKLDAIIFQEYLATSQKTIQLTHALDVILMVQTPYFFLLKPKKCVFTDTC